MPCGKLYGFNNNIGEEPETQSPQLEEYATCAKTKEDANIKENEIGEKCMRRLKEYLREVVRKEALGPQREAFEHQREATRPQSKVHLFQWLNSCLKKRH